LFGGARIIYLLKLTESSLVMFTNLTEFWRLKLQVRCAARCRNIKFLCLSPRISSAYISAHFISLHENQRGRLFRQMWSSESRPDREPDSAGFCHDPREQMRPLYFIYLGITKDSSHCPVPPLLAQRKWKKEEKPAQAGVGTLGWHM